ncbi:TetR/AcrR family transcriptional regulator [Aquabacter spiritensis]|uniref:TetR family transcriptional regulator n=1 Tax=Aquabacter spiritensis TaxID=933073 RepID=A0A4R3LTT8_9HYPH|nr:TetR/AcrR family transcriptional regulator [Aquabacter spiritensis]TCT03990.1 TetR family transcriptional regulator [Aquabacter spiritensis]
MKKQSQVRERETPARAKSPPRPAGAKRPSVRTRLDPTVRERMILEAAVEFFAEHGFEAQTKELAERIGVSQGLIFRYFGTKQNLVEQVYQKVFLSRWSQAWELGLRDRSVPFPDRLERFYLSYFDAVDESTWIRVSLYASLAGHDITARYVQTHVNRLLEIVLSELQVYRGLPDDSSVDPIEFELVWHLHSTFIYFLVRKYIHRLPVAEDKPMVVARIVANFLNEFISVAPASDAPPRKRRAAAAAPGKRPQRL